jgi:NAD(P)-dependent dehydrogenase (short-subunit alcohol dehydrogenase family)
LVCAYFFGSFLLGCFDDGTEFTALLVTTSQPLNQLFSTLTSRAYCPTTFIMAASNRTLFVIGSGPGIGRSVTTLFASKRYSHVALIARRAEQLSVEQKALEEAVGSDVKVKTYAVDVVDSNALLKVLEDAEAALGKPEVVFYNAARVLPSALLSHDVKDMEYDFKINVSALYVVAQRVIPQLTELAKSDPSATPALIVTSSMLPQHPIPQLFVLSLVKAAQRNLMQSLALTYDSILVGLINVGGQVSPDAEVHNPTNIAAKAWEWFSKSKESKSFEVLI